MLKWKFRDATLIPYLLGILKFENVYEFKVPLFTYKIINDLFIEPSLKPLRYILIITDLLLN